MMKKIDHPVSVPYHADLYESAEAGALDLKDGQQQVHQWLLFFRNVHPEFKCLLRIRIKITWSLDFTF